MTNLKKLYKDYDLTKGSIPGGLWGFALPLMLGNVLQQLYNLVDTWIVGRFIGNSALAAVGSAYTLMTFMNSIIIGLCMGSGTYISMAYGKRNFENIRKGIFMSFSFIAILTFALMAIFYGFQDHIIKLLNVPRDVFGGMKIYTTYIFTGFFAVFIYNFISNILRGIGNSLFPLIFLMISVVLNIFLDVLFVAGLELGIMGAAVATVIAQVLAAAGLLAYFLKKYPDYILWTQNRAFGKNICKSSAADKAHIWDKVIFAQILSLSGFTCLQQSVMNFGILTVQGIVNSFGATVMAAFAVAVKIDTIAYMPVQDFGNAFSVYVAQNYGAGKPERIKKGIKVAALNVCVFCILVSAVVFFFAPLFMKMFITDGDVGVIYEGVRYLRIEGAFYIGIGILFMLYGYYRAINRPAMSVVLTIISLGTRVMLAYILSKTSLGVIGIWVAIPIGWFLADMVGIICSWRQYAFG